MDSLLQSLQAAIDSAAGIVFPLAFVAGVATGLNPCVYPTIPVIIGFITGQTSQTKLRGFALAFTFVIGLAITYVILGATVGFLGSVLGLSRTVWMYIVAGICILVGLNMAGLMSLNFSTIAPGQSKWSELSGFAGALLLGMLFGLVASPCAVPVLALIVALVASEGKVVYGSTLMFLYALGHGLPLVIIGTVTGALTSLERFSQYSVTVQRVGGWLLIAVGSYLIWYA